MVMTHLVGVPSGRALGDLGAGSDVECRGGGFHAKWGGFAASALV